MEAVTAAPRNDSDSLAHISIISESPFMMKPADLYHYKAYVTRVPSSTICLVDIDLGLGVWTRGQAITLHRVVGPEAKPAADEARSYLRSLILDREVLLRTIKDRREKGGRILGELTVVTEVGKKVNVINEMIKKGYYTKIGD